MGSTDHTAQKQLELITKGLTEIHGLESIHDILLAGKKPKCFWGWYTALSIFACHTNALQPLHPPENVSFPTSLSRKGCVQFVS